MTEVGLSWLTFFEKMLIRTVLCTLCVYSMVTWKASVAMVAAAVAPHGHSDGHGHDHSLAVISLPSHQPYQL